MEGVKGGGEFLVSASLKPIACRFLSQHPSMAVFYPVQQVMHTGYLLLIFTVKIIANMKNDC